MRLSKFENYLLKKIGKAMTDYNMLGENDRILACISGGKDSLSMLRLLLLKNRQLPVKKKYSLVAAHINFGTCEQHKVKLDDFFKQYGVQYHIENATLPKKDSEKMSDCFWCSWNRRKLLFKLAEKYSCRKIALAHHLDDIVETLLMNQFFYGEISTMPPNISMFDGEFNIIRPLAYIPEKSLNEYATRMNLPVSTTACPFSANGSRRKFIKELIGGLEKKCSYLKVNLFRSMKRIKPKYLT
jgi:tRNA 2-thiocytidine biosynthesis protein TtcA